MTVVSVINYKGGVGKTTITANLAAGLACCGWKVLLIDCDPQCSLTFSFIQGEEWENLANDEKTIKKFFDAILDESKTVPFKQLIIQPITVELKLSKLYEKDEIWEKGEIFIIPSHLGLINVDLELAGLLTGTNRRRQRQSFFKVYKRIIEGLESLDEMYDYVLIDCPPNLNIVTKSAISASNYILIPSKPDYISTLGIGYLKEAVEEFVREFNDWATSDDPQEKEIDPQMLGIIFNVVKVRNHKPIAAQSTYITRTKREKNIPVFDTYIRDIASIVATAPQAKVPVILGERSNPIASELKSFVNEFHSKIHNSYKSE
jgi:chromosome partitioning protein